MISRKDAVVESVLAFEAEPEGAGGKTEVWMGCIWEVNLRDGNFATPAFRVLHEGMKGVHTIGDCKPPSPNTK